MRKKNRTHLSAAGRLGNAAQPPKKCIWCRGGVVCVDGGGPPRDFTSILCSFCSGVGRGSALNTWPQGFPPQPGRKKSASRISLQNTSKTTRFNNSESTLSFERRYLYTWFTFRFKTLQDVFIHLELCYTLYERSFSKIHNRGTLISQLFLLNGNEIKCRANE